ncbi:MAG: hypothetical protein R3F59_10530 [Myxococcota bacterium]
MLMMAGCGKDPYGDGDDLQLADDLGEWEGSDLSCDKAKDCLAGETCVEGVCQIDRCNAAEITHDSVAPMGQGLNFLQDAELGVADRTAYDGAYWVDAYQPHGGDAYDWSVEAGASRIVDIAGGHFDESEAAYAAALQGDTAVTILGTGQRLSTGFVPAAIDAGDVDGDGLDEIVAVAASDDIAICHADTGQCDRWVSEGSTMVDVAVGDIDGDTFEEPILLIDIDGARYLYAFQPNAEVTGEDLDYFSHVGGDEMARVTAGDLDGDWKSEVVLLENPWCGDFCDDNLYSYDAMPDGTFAYRMNSDIENQTTVVDIAAGDVDNDDVTEVVTLGGSASVTLQEPAANRWNERYHDTLTVSGNPDRIAMGDHDHDAPRARLIDGPERQEGRVVPMMVLTLPPYHRQYSSGVASVGFGDNESQEESRSDTVSLSLSADVGVDAEFFGLFGTSFSAKVDNTVSHTLATSRSMIIGSRYNLAADPDTFGPNYGAVVVGWGCFDAYLYEVDDPANKLGGNGEKMVVTVPIGGGEAMYNSARYNAMAKTMGLPTVDIPYTVGDPSSYPREAVTLQGDPITEDDLLFPEAKKYTVSDVGQVGWWNMAGETVTNTDTTSFGMGGSAGIKAFGVKVGVSATETWGSSYGLSVGSAALFWGSLPPLPDDLDTPEDEYAKNRFSVTPYLYQQFWEDEDGNEAKYWVTTYQVGD